MLLFPCLVPVVANDSHFALLLKFSDHGEFGVDLGGDEFGGNYNESKTSRKNRCKH